MEINTPDGVCTEKSQPRTSMPKPNGRWPLQVMLPAVHRKAIGVQQSESMRTVVLRGLKTVEVHIRDEELVARRRRG